ncbi:uncharacterized protein LOC126821340 [Patella vulgata]|uniref:uncharacterized protein LOC126821340 n=1 Tax=Patella vulgata TaxID=6465 RepID=UPI0024A97E00|nr:uncharacterized protein LOC126821340 [Patella vulgata]
MNWVLLVPENDEALYHIKRMREELGWITDIPRHAPGCKNIMEKIVAIPVEKIDKLTAIQEDSGDFLYCLPRNRHDPRAKYDPYDLQVVSPNEARLHKIYWTISASFITMCIQGSGDMQDESSNTPALWWMWERRHFYQIHLLNIFVKFRLQKTFKNWCKNIRKQKNSANQVTLYKTLFIANEILQGCLVHVKTLCEVARGGCKNDKGDMSIISLVKLDKSKTLSLQTFKDIQKQQCSTALTQLNQLRENVIDIVWQSCAAVAEMEGVQTGIRPTSEKRVRIEDPFVTSSAIYYLRNSKYRLRLNLGKDPVIDPKKSGVNKDKPLYAEIAKWRKILARMASFLQSVDYLLMDLLRCLVKSAVKQLLDQFVVSYHAHDDEDQPDEVGSVAGSDSSLSNRSSYSYRPYKPQNNRYLYINSFI